MVKKNDNNKDSGAKDKAGKPAGRKSKALALAIETFGRKSKAEAGRRNELAENWGTQFLTRSDESLSRPQSLASVKTAADIGRLIRVARRRMDLNQQDFADLAGVGRRFVSELEGGKPTLEFDRVIQVCAAAGIDLSASQRAS